MKLLIVTHVMHHRVNGQWMAYAPYVREMNLWGRHVDSMLLVAPAEEAVAADPIEIAYEHGSVILHKVSPLDFTSPGKAWKSLIALPGILWKLRRLMKQADHIHLRCPGNMGLLGCLVQMAFPGKPKTAKYAGNWDPASSQPLSYRLQRWMLGNTFLSRRMQVMVYGLWPGDSRNIVPFFTASYPAAAATAVERTAPPWNPVRFVFAGALHPGKRPLVACEVILHLRRMGHDARLDLYGEGPERPRLENFIATHGLDNYIRLMGNKPADELSAAYRNSHFLLFLSESEGWPKVVAEAMWWGCLPVTTRVSCVPQMLGEGSRGFLVGPDAEQIARTLSDWMANSADTAAAGMQANAMAWSRQYTQEAMEAAIIQLLQP